MKELLKVKERLEVVETKELERDCTIHSRKLGFSRKQQSSEGASVIATGSSPNGENKMATHESGSEKHE